MRILVCGGRNYSNYELVSRTLKEYGRSINGFRDLVIVHGGASGADDLADEWAATNHVPVLVFKADWTSFGKSAGPIRNQKMMQTAKPDLVLAFPGGRGTADMTTRAKAAGIEVIEIKESPT